MAKAPATPAADPVDPRFQSFEMPQAARAPGKAGGEPSELVKNLTDVPVGLSFLEAVTVPDTITDAAEREKAFKEAARKKTNQIGGAIRRFRKNAANANRNYGLRTVNDDTLGHGVRVWRVADTETPAAPAAPVPPAPPAPPAG